jgi:hypothetical protein
METNETRSLRALLHALAGPEGELVVLANAFGAAAAGLVATFAYRIPLGWSILLAAGLFVVLMLCLLSPRAAWVPAIVGGAVLAVVPAALFGAVAVRLYPPAFWAAAGAGLVLGFWTGARALLAFGRRARGPLEGPPDAR